MSPTRKHYQSLGLPLSYLEWPGPHPDAETLIFLHGYLDHAASFTPVAEILQSRFRIIAPDHRGHGQSGWVGPGGYYHFPDYLLDLQALRRHLGDPPVHLIGHSMGASIAIYHAGVTPESLLSLTLLDGIGPAEHPLSRSPALMRRWLHDTALVEARGRQNPRPMPTQAEVIRHLKRTAPHASDARLAQLAETATRYEDGAYHWLFDPLHRTTAPIPFDLRRFEAFLQAITCPTFIIWGEHTPMRPKDAEPRMALIPHLRRAEIAGCAHNLHHERPDNLAHLLLPFLTEHTDG